MMQDMMPGMMWGLKGLEPAKLVKAIAYCHDTCRITTADGKTRASWSATCAS